VRSPPYLDFVIGVVRCRCEWFFFHRQLHRFDGAITCPRQGNRRIDESAAITACRLLLRALQS